MNALADPKVGEFLNEHFVSAFQKVATFQIVNGQNIAAAQVSQILQKHGVRVLPWDGAAGLCQTDHGLLRYFALPGHRRPNVKGKRRYGF